MGVKTSKSVTFFLKRMLAIKVGSQYDLDGPLLCYSTPPCAGVPKLNYMYVHDFISEIFLCHLNFCVDQLPRQKYKRTNLFELIPSLSLTQIPQGNVFSRPHKLAVLFFKEEELVRN